MRVSVAYLGAEPAGVGPLVYPATRYAVIVPNDGRRFVTPTDLADVLDLIFGQDEPAPYAPQTIAELREEIAVRATGNTNHPEWLIHTHRRYVPPPIAP